MAPRPTRLATSLSHTYGSAGTDTVSLIVSGPVGVSTNTQANYIVVITPAQLGVNPGSLNYGSITVGLTNSLSFSVINSGQQTLTGTVATASPFLITSGSPYTVAGGQTATVSVAFAPVAIGSFTNSAIFTSNGGVSTNTVTGTGLAIGNISVSPASYSFGRINHRHNGPDDIGGDQQWRHSGQQRHGQRDRAILDPVGGDLQRTGLRHHQCGGAVCASGGGWVHQQRDLHQYQWWRNDQ